MKWDTLTDCKQTSNTNTDRTTNEPYTHASTLTPSGCVNNS